MPPLALARVLNDVLPPLTRTARAVVEVLVCNNGLIADSDPVPTYLGLRTRHQVARALRRAGLPPLEELAGWTRVLYWLLQSEQTGASLFNLAHQASLEPATCYRLVRRLTGQPWSRIRRDGLEAAVRRFRDSIKPGRTDAVTAAHERRWSAPVWTAAPGARKAAGNGSPAIVLNGTTRPHGVLADRLRLPGYPFDVVITRDGTGWLTRTHAAVLERLQLSPLRSLGFIPVGVAPTRVVVSAPGDRAWVTNQFTKDIAVVDLVRQCCTGIITMSGDPLGAVPSPDGHTLYVTTNLDKLCACALSESGGHVVRSLDIPQSCTEVTVHPAGHRVYVPTWRGGSVLEVDARTLTVLREFAVGGQPLGIAISRDGLRLYSGNEEGWLDVIHLSTGQYARRTLGTPIEEVALTPDQSAVYVSLRTAGRVAVIDAHTLGTLGTLDTGGLPRHVAFDATGRFALIANETGWVDLVR
jgi:YVTN family beta-propeller protein